MDSGFFSHKQAEYFIARQVKNKIPLIVSHMHKRANDIGGVMVSMVASSVVDRVFEPQSGKTEEKKIGICCFSAKHAALRSKSKYWLAQNQNNVSRVERYVYQRTVVSVS
jgi:hypothetical protein